ncbi:MAG: hypothetical protein ACOYJG_02385 [Prevotella sp.]|jgi:hypothetical protein
MRRFFLLVSVGLLALLQPFKAMACISEAPTHNAYLFSVYDNRLMINNPFTDRVNSYWRNYVGSSEEYFDCENDSTLILNTARQKGDSETSAYLRLLYDYVSATNKVYNGWDYPTKEELAYYNNVVSRMLTAARRYKGKRLRPQYALMEMRALFAQKNYKAASKVWKRKGSKMSESVFRDMMENLYAGCLLRMNQKRQAVEIYAQQQDFESLKYCVRKYRNLAGIKSIYAENPNSATLLYLVQDFVNNTQETMDLFESNRLPITVEADSDKQNWMKQIDRKAIYRQEALDFVSFAQQVLSEGKTQNPCLWQTAIGCIHHILGDTQTADKELKAALSMAGTDRMKDNARAIYAVNSVSVSKMDNDYLNWIAKEMEWLRSKDTKEPNGHYADVLDRLVFNNLVPSLRKSGNNDLALALIASQQPELWYSGEYFDELQKLSADQLIAYQKWCGSKSQNALETYVKQYAPKGEDYYNDLIGTRLLACGRWADAIPYLEKVSMNFLGEQAIAPYAKKMNFNVDRWITDQKIKWEEMSTPVSLTTNKKIDFCKEMMEEEAKYRLMREGLEKRKQAYKLASLYYQASYEGDCWWLTQYGVSYSQDSALVGTKDFVAEAIQLLGVAKSPKWTKKEVRRAFDLQQNTLYALAFIRRGDYLSWTYDAEYNAVKHVDLNARRYQAMSDLYNFYHQYPDRVAKYVSHCDVLKKFQP